MARPTALEIRHWQARNNFACNRSAAECLGVNQKTYAKWLQADSRAPAVVRRLMAYIDRFGKWDQVLKMPDEAIKAWQATLPEAEDNAAQRGRSEKQREKARLFRANRALLATDKAGVDAD